MQNGNLFREKQGFFFKLEKKGGVGNNFIKKKNVHHVDEV